MAALAGALALVAMGCSQDRGGSAPAGRLASAATAPSGSIRVAGIVLKWITADKGRNYSRAEPLIREAAARGAEIVITTECFLDGYAIHDKSIPLEAYRALGEPVPDGPYF